MQRGQFGPIHVYQILFGLLILPCHNMFFIIILYCLTFGEFHLIIREKCHFLSIVSEAELIHPNSKELERCFLFQMRLVYPGCTRCPALKIKCSLLIFCYVHVSFSNKQGLFFLMTKCYSHSRSREKNDSKFCFS